MDFIVSLAHFCEVHGPTSILCTQILPQTCITCQPSRQAPCDYTHKQNGLQSPTTHGLSKHVSHEMDTLGAPQLEAHPRHSSFSTSKSHLVSTLVAQQQRHAEMQCNTPSSPFHAPSAIMTPPSSPLLRDEHKATLAGSYEASRRSSDVSTTSSSNLASTNTCANCTFSIPETLTKQLPEGAPGSPSKHGSGKNGSPVLRTREALMAGACPDNFTNSEDVERPTQTHEDRVVPPSTRPVPVASPSASSMTASPRTPNLSRASTFTSTTSSSSPPHAHAITYLTTRLPPSLQAHSLLRRSIIRTLSCETPPRPHSSGPLLFGDAAAGYTIAYAFRIPDRTARGRSRRYAFVAWAGRDERRATRAYRDVLSAFAGMAARIADLVDRREEPCTSTIGSPCDATPPPVQSFLSGRLVDPDGFPRREADGRRARGLAELVGREDVFVEVHAVFVRLLAHLGRALGGWPVGGSDAAATHGEVGDLPDGIHNAPPPHARKASVDHNHNHASSLPLHIRDPTAAATVGSSGLGIGMEARPLESGGRAQVVV